MPSATSKGQVGSGQMTFPCPFRVQMAVALVFPARNAQRPFPQKLPSGKRKSITTRRGPGRRRRGRTGRAASGARRCSHWASAVAEEVAVVGRKVPETRKSRSTLSLQAKKLTAPTLNRKIRNCPATAIASSKFATDRQANAQRVKFNEATTGREACSEHRRQHRGKGGIGQ